MQTYRGVVRNAKGSANFPQHPNFLRTMLTQKRLRVIDEGHRYRIILYDGHSEYRFQLRMRKAGMLEVYKLPGGGKYHRLAGQGSLGPQHLPLHYAIARWCRSEGYIVPHPWERESAFPWLPRGVLVATGNGGLAVFKIDMGGEPDALARKAIEIHEKLLSNPEYLRCKPRVWVLTGTEGKAYEINQYLSRSEHRRFLAVSIVEGYAELLGGRSHAEKSKCEERSAKPPATPTAARGASPPSSCPA